MHVKDGTGVLLNVPAVQILQAVDSTLISELATFLPAAQLVQDGEPSPLYLPSEHWLQSKALVGTGNSLYVPA